MNKNELNEKILDEIIKYAAANQAEKAAEGLPPKEELASQHAFSQEFKKKMGHLFVQQKRKERSAKTLKNALKVAVIVFLILAALTATIFSVDALRLPVLNFFFVTNKESMTIHFKSGAGYDDYADQFRGYYLPEYIPDGYWVSSFDRGNGILYHIEYKNSAGDIIHISSLTENSAAGIDYEGVQKEQLTINGEMALYVYENGGCTLLYQYDELVFRLSAELPKEEVVRIAESMKYMK